MHSWLSEKVYEGRMDKFIEDELRTKSKTKIKKGLEMDRP